MRFHGSGRLVTTRLVSGPRRERGATVRSRRNHSWMDGTPSLHIAKSDIHENPRVASTGLIPHRPSQFARLAPWADAHHP